MRASYQMWFDENRGLSGATATAVCQVQRTDMHACDAGTLPANYGSESSLQNLKTFSAAGSGLQGGSPMPTVSTAAAAAAADQQANVQEGCRSPGARLQMSFPSCRRLTCKRTPSSEVNSGGGSNWHAAKAANSVYH